MKTLFGDFNFSKLNLFPGRIKGNGNGKGKKQTGTRELEIYLKQLEDQILDKKEESKHNITELLRSFKDKPIHEINVTYPVNPHHQFARITYDNIEEELLYIPVEPVLDKKDKEIFQRIRGIFERELDKDSIHASREIYIEKRVADIIDLYGIRVSSDVLEKIVYFIKRDFIGYGEIDLMMKDPMIEDISCNGPGRNVYIYHRIFESLRTQLKFESEYRLNSFILKMAQISLNSFAEVLTHWEL